jgi:predicted O-linked N-acetylglucosamine transferase (SPINDLY family)
MSEAGPSRTLQAHEKSQPQDTAAVRSRLQQALAFQQRGQLDEAQLICREIVTHAPDNFDAAHLLGIIEGQRGNAAAAAQWISLALRINPHDASAHSNIGIALLDLKRPEEALASYDRALVLMPDFAGALVGRGKALLDLKRPEEALASYDRALALKPDFAGALNGRGNALLDLKRPEEALASYDRALKHQPDYVEVLNNRGNVLLYLDRAEEALASFDLALRFQPDYVDAINGCGKAMLDLRRPEEALACHDRALKLQPDCVEALNNRGNVLLELKRPEDALASYDGALAIRPDFADGLYNRGIALWSLGRPEEALASYDRALAIEPDYTNALYRRGAALWQLKRHGEGIADFKKLLSIQPFHDYAVGRLVNMQLTCCEWADYDESVARVVEGVRAGRRADFPATFLAISDSAADQLTCSRIFAADNYPAASRPVWRGERYRHDRIHLAYLSADFREHPSAYLLAEMFEHHDRGRFETIALSFSDDDRSEIRARLKGAFERFIDVCDRSDLGVARLMRDLEVDIAVDLTGHMRQGRMGILALRPAPVQVNFFCPGTSGADYLDYIICDRVVIPEDHHVHYSEKVAYLPDTFQANDSKRRIAEHTPSRAEAGLPDEGFVFCSFNNSYKFTPRMFDIWMRLLGRVEGASWLQVQHSTTNLVSEAIRRGTEPVGFAPKSV